jgi:hypothetical protein
MLDEMDILRERTCTSEWVKSPTLISQPDFSTETYECVELTNREFQKYAEFFP